MSSRVGSFMVTLPETDIAPENGWLEDEISYWRGLFKGAMLVLGSVMVLKWREDFEDDVRFSWNLQVLRVHSSPEN